MNNKGKGILALLGVAAGAFAFWKYKNMSPEEKQRLKDKANETGRKIREKVEDVRKQFLKNTINLRALQKKKQKTLQISVTILMNEKIPPSAGFFRL